MGSETVYNVACTECCEGYTPGESCSCCPNNLVPASYLITLSGVTNDTCLDCGNMNRSWVLNQLVGGCTFNTNWEGLNCNDAFGNPFWFYILLDQCITPEGTFYTAFTAPTAPGEARFQLAAPAASCVVSQTVPLIQAPANTNCNWTGASLQIVPI